MKKNIILFTLVIIASFLSCDDRSLGLPVTYNIKYEITGTTSSVDITMNNAGDNTEQMANVSIPWEKSFSIKVEKGDYYFAYISAQNNKSSGSVTAKIYVDGNVFEEATSSGAYVIATASGSVKY